MKRLFLLMIPLLAGLVSCNDTESENTTVPTPTPGETTYAVTYEVGSPSLLDANTEGFDNLLFYDLTVSYKNADGTMTENVVVDSYPWSVTLNDVKAPFEAQISVNASLKEKEAIVTDKTSFNITSLNNVNISYTSSDNKSYSDKTTSSLKGISLDNAYRYLSSTIEKYNGKVVTLAVPYQQ